MGTYLDRHALNECKNPRGSGSYLAPIASLATALSEQGRKI